MSAVQIPAHVAEGFLSAFSGVLAADVATKLTCSEVEALAELLSAIGANEQARGWIEEHAENDEPGDAHGTEPAEESRVRINQTGRSWCCCDCDTVNDKQAAVCIVCDAPRTSKRAGKET